MWRKLNPGQQALLVLACLRKGETFASPAAGFGTATAWRYAEETVALLATRAPRLRKAVRDAARAGHAYVVLDGTLPNSAAGKSGDTKTRKSKRSLVLPKRAITALHAHRALQDRERIAASNSWQGTNLVFFHEDGSMYTSDALNWRFSKMTRKADIGHRHAHEGRHTAVSIMSSNGVPI